MKICVLNIKIFGYIRTIQIVIEYENKILIKLINMLVILTIKNVYLNMYLKNYKILFEQPIIKCFNIKP